MSLAFILQKRLLSENLVLLLMTGMNIISSRKKKADATERMNVEGKRTPRVDLRAVVFRRNRMGTI